MPAITYADFSGGLDRRLPINVQEASRLWSLRNAYVTLGKRIRKRPALRRLNGDLIGSTPANGDVVGLEAVNGRLKVFVQPGQVIFNKPALIDVEILDQPVGTGGAGLLRAVHYADLFQGYLYVVAEYEDPVSQERYIKHHYLDGVTGIISDVNCPHSISVTKAASRIFAIDGEVVRYCAAGDAADWTTASDAGFLPAGLQQDTKSDVTAVGVFEDALVAFFAESAQIWDVAVDPSANALRKRIFGVGITTAPLSPASFAKDLCFLSPFGFRSMTVSQQTDRIDDTDIGVPVDSLVVPDIVMSTAQPNPAQTFGIWIHQLGQYWAVFDMGTHSKVWAYTYSRSSKIACWSEYTFPVRITAIATLNGRVYVRDASFLYELTEDQHTDDGTLISVEVQMAFQDAKSPGVAKQIYGGDYVVEGSPQVSFKYDPRDPTKETVPMTIPGDTRPGDVLPVEIVAPAIAPVFRHSVDEAFELDAATFYFNTLGPV